MPDDTPDTTTSTTDGDGTTDGPEPHGDDTDWKAEARKWETRAKSNKDAAARLAELEEAAKTDEQKRTEALEAAEKRASAAERRLMVLEVAADKGLTPAQAKRLAGDTREDLEADADDLLELLAPPPQDDKQDPPPGGRPKRLISGNGDPDGDSQGFDAKTLADQIYERTSI